MNVNATSPFVVPAQQVSCCAKALKNHFLKMSRVCFDRREGEKVILQLWSPPPLPFPCLLNLGILSQESYSLEMCNVFSWYQAAGSSALQ